MNIKDAEFNAEAKDAVLIAESELMLIIGDEAEDAELETSDVKDVENGYKDENTEIEKVFVKPGLTFTETGSELSS